MIYLNCLFITLICVIITDIFCFWDNFSRGVVSLLTKGKINAPIKGKLFYCSLCQSFWSNLIYIIVMGVVSIPMLLYILLLSFSTNILKQILLLIEDKIITLINKLQ